MPVGEIRRWTPVSISPARSGVGGHQSGRPLGNAEPPQKFGLGDRTVGNQSHRAGLARDGRELNVGRQVGNAGQAQRIDPGVPVHGLEGIAIGRSGRPVVDEEGDVWRAESVD